MSKIIYSIFIFVLIQATALVLPSANAQISDYYMCNSRESGEWNFGRVPMVCDANSWGRDQDLVQNFDPVIFDDVANRTSERSRYMNELNAVIRDAAIYYIKKRNPNVGTDELNNWVLAVMVTATAETYWSHYRQTSDRRYKLMRGDFGHGHGMMQVDDRSHFPAIQQGIGWNLISNMTYGMDILYTAWLRAPSQSCVGSATNWTARIRSSWAAYNGGPARICRWTNPNDAWARNDQNFYDQLQNKRWLNYVANPQMKSSVNVACLIENRENCSSVGGGEVPPPSMQTKTLYRTVDGKMCILVGSQAQCVREERDRVCLNTLEKYSSDTAENISDSLLAKYNPVVYDRHELCSKYDPSILKVGTILDFVISINLRATPGGGLLTTVAQGSKLEALDFELRNAPANDRYYKVRYNNQVGYVYAGTSANYATWIVGASLTSEVPSSSVARMGAPIQVMASSGIFMRATPGGALIEAIPYGYRLQVLEVVVRGTNNEIFYKVAYNGRVGYIYSGVLLPKETVKAWTKAL